jgi:tetratricopeptide (TPR) repeat protein
VRHEATPVPLQHFFEQQVRDLRAFLNTPGEKLRVLLTDEDTKVVTHKLLAGLDNDDRVTSVFVPTDAAFETPAAFFEAAYAELVESYNLFADELAAAYVLPPPEWTALKVGDPAERFARAVAMFANALPGEAGAVAFLFDPAEVADPAGYRKALKYLAEHTPSDWVKFLVLDDRLKRHTAELAGQMPKVRVQSMYLPPDELEKRVNWHLATGVGVGPVEKRIYTGLLASFALARKDHDGALRLSHEQLKLTERGTPNDLAAVHYNIGNAHLAKEDHAAAAESFATALELAMKAGLSAIVPSILCNLGVALFHGGAREQADECFATSRVYCEKLNLRPTEAHVLDCMARCHTQAGRPAEAERCWNEALAKYDEITAPQMAFARDGGRKLILMMLEQHYQGTKQADKLAAVRGELAAAG